MIQCEGVAKSFGTQLLFQGIQFVIGKGERVGLVGRNGSGKSTLFKLILGEELPDTGQFIVPKNYQLGTLKQHLEFHHPTILEECMSALKGEAIYDQYKVEKMLLGLGFKEEDLNRSPSDFSGGYQIRLNLAKVLLAEPDCLLLDEPTNYLDIVSMRWLSKFLRQFKGEIVIITHDRGFMDEVTTHTMGIWREKIVKIRGNSDKYLEQVLAEEEIYEKTRQNNEKKKKDLEAFVARFKSKASKATQAQSRMKILEKMPELEALAMVSSLDFEFNHHECPGKILMEVKDLSFGYKEENLFQKVHFAINKSDKIAIIGKNGKGKSTLLNLLAGDLNPREGSISKNINLLIGHFGQTNINRLNLENTIEEEVASVDQSLGLQRVRSLCATMMFSGDLAKKKIKVLSGGERARVLLAKLLAKPANLLLLDEPTNHLDQESVDALTLELENYPGAVVIVTHSESMLRQVANRLIVFHQNKVEDLNLGYDEFLTKIGWEDEIEVSSPEKNKDRPSRQEMKRLRAELVVERGRLLNPLKKKMEKLEQRIIQFEEEQQKLEADLIAWSAQGESKKIQESSLRLGSIKKTIEEDFEALAIVTGEHDQIFNSFEAKLLELSE